MAPNFAFPSLSDPMPTRRIAMLLLLVMASWPCIALTARRPLPAQEIKVNALIADTQQTSLDSKEVEIAWWIPPEYWQASLSQQPDVNAEMRRQFAATFDDYNIVAIVQGSMADDLQYRFSDEASVRESTRLVDTKGGTHQPLPLAQIPPALAATLAFLKPILSASMGPMGESMYFIVFPGNDDRGNRLIDPVGDGRMRITTRVNEYSFRLPLGALLPEQRDAASGESFPGDFLYNPYTGSALQSGSP